MRARQAVGGLGAAGCCCFFGCSLIPNRESCVSLVNSGRLTAYVVLPNCIAESESARCAVLGPFAT